MRKMPGMCATMDDKGQAGQADLKGISNDEISTKKEGSNVSVKNGVRKQYRKPNNRKTQV